MKRSWLTLFSLFFGVFVWAEDIDQEIIKNFDFFYHMDVVEDLDTLDHGDVDDLDGEDKPAPSASDSSKEKNHAKI